MANTFDEIIAKVYNLLAVSNDSTTYDLATVVKPKINSVIEDVCKGRYQSVLEERVYQAGDLKFLKGKSFYDIVRPKALGAPLSVSDTTMTLVSSSYQPSGYVYIWWDVIYYAVNSWIDLQNITWQLTNHNLWDAVEQIYLMPADADRSFTLYELDRYGAEIEVPYANSIHGMSQLVNYAVNVADTFWTVVNDSVGNNYLLIRSWRPEGTKFRLWYYRWVQPLVAGNSLCPIPWSAGLEIIAHISAGELLRDTEEDPHGSKLLKLGYSKLDTLYSNQVDYNKPSRQKVKIGNRSAYSYPDVQA